MYLISVYFDEESNKRIQRYINKVGKHTNNHYMIDNHVPPHMTILSFQSQQEEEIIKKLKNIIDNYYTNQISYVSLGFFLPYVIYITPVLNRFLEDLSLNLYNELKEIKDISFIQTYIPYNWFPHTTIGKKLNQEEMRKAFEVLQKDFQPFQAKVTKISLSKTNPYEDIISFRLKELCNED